MLSIFVLLTGAGSWWVLPQTLQHNLPPGVVIVRFIDGDSITDICGETVRAPSGFIGVDVASHGTTYVSTERVVLLRRLTEDCPG